MSDATSNEKIFSDVEAFAQELKREAAIQYIMEFYGIDRYACMELYMDEVKAYMELNNE